jgi:type VI secretion system protein ImpB
MSGSLQHKLSRVRPPRVQITYDVETLGSIQKKELPFIVGILADLSGKPDPESATPLPKLKERKFVEIDRDNFDAVLESIGPRVAFQVPNRLQADATNNLNVVLNFKKMEDFSPENLVQQIKPLRELFEARRQLNDLLAKLDGNDNLDALLREVLAGPPKQAAIANEAQAEPEAQTEPEAPPA